MTYRFRLNSSDRIDHGSGASLDDLPGSAGGMTLCFSVLLHSIASGPFLCNKSTSLTTGWSMILASGENRRLRYTHYRATTNTQYDSPVGTIALGRRMFIVLTHDDAASPRVEMYRGFEDLDVVKLAPNLTAGSGALSSDASDSLLIGFTSGGAGCAWDALQIYNRILTIEEMRMIQKQMLKNPVPLVLPNCVLASQYDTGPVMHDWSGNGNNGTVIGATLIPQFTRSLLPGGAAYPVQVLDPWSQHFVMVSGGAAAISGESTQALPLAGSAVATVGLAGTSTATLPLSGSVTAILALAGESSAALPLSGSAAATVLLTGDSTQALPFAGAAAGALALLADSSQNLPLAGTATGIGDGLSGESPQALPLSGSATATLEVAGASSSALPFGGVATGASANTATSSRALPLAGTATGTTELGATALGALPLSGSATGTLAIAAVSIRPLPFIGTATGVTSSASLAPHLTLRATLRTRRQLRMHHDTTRVFRLRDEA